MNCLSKKMDKLVTLEYKHRENMNRAYMLYSVLRDLYKRDKKKKLSDKIISENISKQFTDQDYIYNKNKLEESYVIASEFLLLSKKRNTLRNIYLLIEDNMKFIKRIIDTFRDIIINRRLSKLKYEIRLENKDIKDFEKDFNDLP